MSTRSFIGIQNLDGTVTGIYCHHDGYLAGVGATLKAHYTTVRQVLETGRFGLQQGLVPLRHLPVPRRENAEPASRCRDNQPS